MFLNAYSNLNEEVLPISNYITFCVDSVIPTKITLYPNNKPWVMKHLKGILHMKKIVFLSGTNEEKNR